MTRAFVVTLVLASAVPHAQQSRDAAPLTNRTGTATISGRIVAADDGRPLRRAQVTLRQPDLPAGGWLAMTDDDGRYAFRQLPAGRYTLAARKPAYLPMTYGMKRPSRPGVTYAGSALGTTIVLAEAQALQVDLPLTRGGVISGVITHPTHQPVAGVRVVAAAYVRQGGGLERTLVPVEEATTDDRGQYRIFGLSPGDYVVGVTNVTMASVELTLLSDADLRRADDLLRGVTTSTIGATPAPGRPTNVGYVPVYYPGTTVPADALTVKVGPGEERLDINVTVQYVPTARVTGTVTFPDGRPAPGASVQALEPASQSMMLASPWAGGGSTDAEGRYALAGIVPGVYSLVARSGRGSVPAATTPLLAQVELRIAGEDQSIDLRLQPGSIVSGRLVFEGGTPPADLSRVRVALATRAPTGLSTPMSGVEPSGQFTIAGVPPGRYTLSAFLTGVSGWSVKSEVHEAPFEVRAGADITDAVIPVTNRITEVTGRVVDSRGAAVPDYTVIIFPADPARWPLGQSWRIQGVRPEQDGRYVFRNLAPGEYVIGAADDVERGDWYDVELLRALAAGGAVRLTLTEGERTVQDLRVR